MAKDLQAWIRHVADVTPAMDFLAKKLENYGAEVEAEETKTVSELSYFACFEFDGALVTIGFNLKDWQTDSDVVITTITTLPETEYRKGHASRAVQKLLHWARDNGLNEVRATQVGNQASEAFWRSNGFVLCQMPNPCHDFVYLLSNGN